MRANGPSDSRAPSMGAELDVIIVTYNSRALISECLESVRAASAGRAVQTIVVDNASQDGTADAVASGFPEVILVRSAINSGFAAGCNLGMRHGTATLQLMLNPDARITPGTLEAALGHMHAAPRCGILGARLEDLQGGLQPSARKFPGPLRKLFSLSGLSARFPGSPLFGGEYAALQNGVTPGSVDWVVGAFFLLRRSMLDEIGKFDERFFLYFEEIDLCLRARSAGWNVEFHPGLRVTHIGGASAATTQDRISRAGRQISIHRIRSELQYYRKNYSTARMLAAWCVEAFWQSLVFVRNLLRVGDSGRLRRASARADLRLLWSALRETFA